VPGRHHSLSVFITSVRLLLSGARISLEESKIERRAASEVPVLAVRSHLETQDQAGIRIYW